jgi:hypothetical protein
VFLRPLATDEYTPPGLDEVQRRTVRRVLERGPDDSSRSGRTLADYWSSRLGTAAGLRAINEEAGANYYGVPAEATIDQESADETFKAADVVIDVHTHYMADHEWLHHVSDWQMNSFRRSAPDWWTGFDGMDFYSFGNYLRSVFLETETAVAVLTSPPADELGVPYLSAAELYGTRALIDRLAGSGRLLNHICVHPTIPEVLDSLERWRDDYHPVAWKVYTPGRMANVDSGEIWEAGTQWMLDDEQTGLPFLERSHQLGVNRVCAHKMGAGYGESPSDMGPIARLYPDMLFAAYHSGCDLTGFEGPFTEDTAHQGANRLITSMLENGIGPNSNVYTDLGTIWFNLLRRPLEAAHLLGKLMLWVGEDNILWGTDSVWYGPTQPLVDSLRVFQIPDELCEQYGYTKLTPEIRAKILGGNAARFYGIDLEAARVAALTDDLAWTSAALREGVLAR